MSVGTSRQGRALYFLSGFFCQQLVIRLEERLNKSKATCTRRVVKEGTHGNSDAVVCPLGVYNTNYCDTGKAYDSITSIGNIHSLSFMPCRHPLNTTHICARRAGREGSDYRDKSPALQCRSRIQKPDFTRLLMIEQRVAVSRNAKWRRATNRHALSIIGNEKQTHLKCSPPILSLRDLLPVSRKRRSTQQSSI